MGSHYDSKKNCRVGTMDEDQFYSECSKASARWFRSLLKQWTRTGAALKWGAGGVGLRATIEGIGEVGICFLAPAFKGKKDRVEISCTTLTKKIGAKRCEALQRDLRAAAGSHLLGASMISIVEPGTLSSMNQKQLSKVLLSFACERSEAH